MQTEVLIGRECCRAFILSPHAKFGLRKTSADENSHSRARSRREFSWWLSVMLAHPNVGDFNIVFFFSSSASLTSFSDQHRISNRSQKWNLKGA